MDPSTALVTLGGVILAFLAYIALLHATRGTPLERIRVLGGDGALDVDEESFREMVEDHLNSELEPGCEVEVLFDGEGTYPRLFADLEAAERLILWHVFWFRPGRLADRLRETLVERAKAGVTVLVLYDAWGGRPIPAEYWRALRAAGVEVHCFRPLRWNTVYKIQRRSHIRAVVVDGRIAYTGGFAIADEWQGDGRSQDQWRDTSVRLRGPIVSQLASVFAAEWLEVTGDLLVGDAIFSAAAKEPRGESRAGILHEAPSLGSTEAERFFALSIAGARETLYLTNAYFVPDDDFRRLFAEAVERGVDVRILTPGRNTDEKITWYAARAHYEELLAAGVRIYEYRPTMVHAKTLVADRHWCAVGSLNFDNRSIAINNEVTALVHDPAVATRLHERFLEDLELADELELATFRERPVWAGALERCSLLASRLI